MKKMTKNDFIKKSLFMSFFSLVILTTSCSFSSEEVDDENSSEEDIVLSESGTSTTYTFTDSTLNYNTTQGYGFVAIDGSLDKVSVSSGTVTANETVRFQAAVSNGNYIVSVTTNQTSVISESITDSVSYTLKNEDGTEYSSSQDFSTNYVDSSTGLPLIGVPKTISSGTEFYVAVCDGVLDLTFVYDSSAITISEITVTPVTNTARSLPYLIAIGDSTCALGDNTIKSSDTYLSWGAAVSNGEVSLPSTLGGFLNCAESGADIVTAYVDGRVEKMLLNVHSGDYVSINMGINNNKSYTIGGVSVAKSGSMNAMVALLEKYYIEGVKQRGGIPFITTITAQGPNSDDTADSNSVYYLSATEVTTSFATDIKAYKSFYNLSSGSHYSSGKNYYAGTTYEVGATVPANTWYNSRRAFVYNILLMYTANAMELPVVDLGVYGENYLNTNLNSESDFATVRDSYYTDKHHYRAIWGKILANYMLEQVSKIQEGSYEY
ncbi:MAG: hypothetical protein K6F69_11325, partial [Treponema sp.]|nr:hypothetical protein [Treponema sp.]